MVQPDIIVSDRVGLGYLSTTFSDPSDLIVTNRKWIFGDGVVIEGNDLSTINHTYYQPGTYTVVLVVQTSSEQFSVTKENLIIVNDLRPAPDFIITQSFDEVSGNYWRFYFDQYFHLVFEDNNVIYRSKDKVVKPGKWQFVDFHRQTGKMYIGSFSYYLKELETVVFSNNNPISFSDTKTEVLPNSTMEIDDLHLWLIEKDTKAYYTDNRGRAGYLDSIE